MDDDKELKDIYKKTGLVQMRNINALDKRENPIQITYDSFFEDKNINIKESLEFSYPKFWEKEELIEYKKTKRKEFEDKLRRQKYQIGTWVQYAEWESRLQEFDRVRSIFERAIEVDYKNVSLWLRYAEFEIKNKFINHARNIWERVCTYMPRFDQFWYKYIYMEEFLGNYDLCIDIFDKWMNWNPPEKAWLSYYNFLVRHKFFGKSRELLYKFLLNKPNLDSFIRVINYEISKKNYKNVEFLFRKCLNDLGNKAIKEKLIKKWVYFLTIQKKYDEAEEIYKWALVNLKDDELLRIKEDYIKFQNLYGNEKDLDKIIYEKRKDYYLNLLNLNSKNYDVLINLLFWEIDFKKFDNLKNIIEIIKNNHPENDNKKVWKRYIYLYIIYSYYLEVEFNNINEAEIILEYIINLCIKFNLYFSVLFINYAEINLRKKNLNKMRSIFGMSINKYPKKKIIKKYIQIELDLGNIERVRKIYEKYCSIFKNFHFSWIEFANFEKNLNEDKRCKEILDIAININNINMPELIWKFYIDYETELNNFEKVRHLYREIINRTRNYKSYLSYGLFEFNIKEFENMRNIFLEGENYLKKNKDFNKERAKLLNIWLKLEEKIGDNKNIELIKNKQPKIELKIKKMNNEEYEEDENESIFEEYEEFNFPEDIKITKGSNLLKLAKLKKN